MRKIKGIQECDNGFIENILSQGSTKLQTTHKNEVNCLNYLERWQAKQIDLIKSQNNTKPNPVTPKLRDILEEWEINLLAKTPCTIPDIKKAFLFSCGTGVRLSDCKNANWSWIRNLNNNEYKVEFRLPLSGLVVSNYIPWGIMNILGQPKNPEDKLFPGISSAKGFQINRVLANWVKDAGINKHITALSGRDTAAVIIYGATGNIEEVQRFLGNKINYPSSVKRNM